MEKATENENHPATNTETGNEVSQDLISSSLDMAIIRYSKVWEDCRILAEGLQINTEDTVLCITSAGDNVLNLLLNEPKEMYAVDLSQAQNSLLELKIAAVKGLDSHEEFLELLGERPSTSRRELFNKVQLHLPKYANDYWTKNIAVIERGLPWEGRLEQFICKFFIEHCKDYLDASTVDKIFLAKTIEEQKVAFNNLPLEQIAPLFKEYHSMASQSKHGRSEKQVRYVEKSSEAIGELTWKQISSMCVSRCARDNYYLSWFMRGNRGFDPILNPDFAPPYLTKDGFFKLKGLVDRITVCTGSVHDIIPTRKFTKLVLSNIFEYFSVTNSDALFKIIADSLEPGAIVAYFELYNERVPPSSTGDIKFKYLKESAERLSAIGRVFHFETLRLYQVL